jgi:hypothetical protein
VSSSLTSHSIIRPCRSMHRTLGFYPRNLGWIPSGASILVGSISHAAWTYTPRGADYSAEKGQHLHRLPFWASGQMAKALRSNRRDFVSSTLTWPTILERTPELVPVPDCKSGVPWDNVGSTPTLSTIFLATLWYTVASYGCQWARSRTGIRLVCTEEKGFDSPRVHQFRACLAQW